MNIPLWIAQGVVALVVLTAGVLKLITPHYRFSKKNQWAAPWPPGRLQLLGVAEVLGAIGVVVPWLTGIAAILTPVAACCVLILMGGAVKARFDLEASVGLPATIGALCAFIALGRFGAL
jgi:uncharacterized membrane protein